MPESLRVRRRVRTIMAPTHTQYAQTVAANAMQGRSFIDSVSNALAGHPVAQ